MPAPLLVQHGTRLAMLAVLLSPDLVTAGGSADRRVVRVDPLQALERVTAFQRLEWRITLDRSYENPFDPDEIAIDAAFVAPDGRTFVVPAFWMGQSNAIPATAPANASTSDRSTSFFAVRFAPPAAGRWTMKVTATDKAGAMTSADVGFDVAPGKSRGFVRRVPGNAQYFQFDSGEPYLALGLNLAWAGKEGLPAYERWFTRLSGAGGNFARIWMSHPNRMMETVEVGVGRYDQDACAFYDAVFEAAECRGIYCMVTFNNHRDLLAKDMWGPAIWPQFPYNAANGGPATRPADFITDPQCQQLYRRRLRYIVGRYAAYTSIAFWELWNEQHYANIDIPPAWTQQMARYLKAVDPYKHLVTTSFGSIPQREVWAMPEIDLTQDHLYPDNGLSDAAESISMSSYRHLRFGKPHLVAEFGINGSSPDADHDKRGIGTNMHHGI